MYLERFTHTQKATFGVKKIYFQFFYSPSVLYRLIKCPLPEKLVAKLPCKTKTVGRRSSAGATEEERQREKRERERKIDIGS